jgi:hypothetical protein
MTHCAKCTLRTKIIVSVYIARREGTRSLFKILIEQFNLLYSREHFKHHCILHQYRRFDFMCERQFFVHSESSKPKIIPPHKCSHKLFVKMLDPFQILIRIQIMEASENVKTDMGICTFGHATVRNFMLFPFK